MTSDIVVPAPAKINLHLAVGGLRSDGFHAISSLFQAISLQDTVRLSLSRIPGIRLSADCGCPPERNTAYAAARAFLEEAAKAGADPVPGLDIAVEKRVPMGAGLGGGSSDAASVLAGLSELLPGRVGAAALRRIAAGVGADVPFFLGSACAAVTGKGEVLVPALPRTDYALVLVEPGFPVSTREAYGLLDQSRRPVSGFSPLAGYAAEGSRAAALGLEARSEARPEAELEAELAGVVRAYAEAPPSSWPFRNDFYDVLAPGLPALTACRDSILARGAAFAAMSGSGSVCFGVFPSESEAKAACAELSSQYTVRLAFPLARLRDSI